MDECYGLQPGALQMRLKRGMRGGLHDVFSLSLSGDRRTASMADGRSANGLQQQQQQLGGGGGGGLRGGQRRAAPLALFRASVRKKDSTVQFVATNCHVHTIYHHDDDEEKRQSLPHGTEGNRLIVETEVNCFFCITL